MGWLERLCEGREVFLRDEELECVDGVEEERVLAGFIEVGKWTW